MGVSHIFQKTSTTNVMSPYLAAGQRSTSGSLMMIISAAFLLSIAARASSFIIPYAPRGQMSALSGYRQNYLFNLEEMHKSGRIMVNGQQVQTTQAVELVEQEIQAVEQDSNDAQDRVTSLEQQIKMTEQERLDTVALLQASLDRQMKETALEQQKEMQITMQSTPTKRQTKKEKAKQKKAEGEVAAVIEQYQAREQQLRKEMAALSFSLAEEKNHIRVNQDMTIKLLETRVELDQQLGALKSKYETDSNLWQNKLQEQRESHARDLAAREAEVATTKAELEQLKLKLEKMEAERNDAASLLSRSLKIMFGSGDK